MSLTKNLNIVGNISELERDVFTELEQERKEWSVPYVKNNIEFGRSTIERLQISDCISRIVAISLNMELPIGAFVRSLLDVEKSLPMSAKIGLVKNIIDEEKHQQAFENVAKSYQVKPEDLKIANEYRKLLVKYDTHPLIKSRDLETIVFIPMQTALRHYGSQSLERVISYISLDEYRHIQYGWNLSEILNLRFDHNFEDVLMGICSWVFEPLKDTNLNFKYWMDGVREMRETGESVAFTDLMSYGICLSPFEISNDNY